jgi:dihydrolipoamide dehydrogenase
MNFDVVVIGGGPGGYIAAIRASQLGLKTACIDATKRNGAYSLGGTCLNVGCIPSKALLQSSENYAQIQHEFAQHGITCGEIKLDLSKMQERKDNIISKNANGINFLFKKNKVTLFNGFGEIVANVEGKWEIKITADDKVEKIIATNVIIASGSNPRSIPNVTIDNINILDNDGALNLKAVPQNLCIIGAGVIGLEMGSVWKRLGSQVTILEAMDTFLPTADIQVGQELYKNLTKQGLEIRTKIKIEAVTATSKKIKIKYYENDELKEITSDKLILAVGRTPNTSKLGAAKIGLNLDERGFINVDEHCKTNLPNIWAVGDCVRGPMLAHKASEEGVAVAERIAGQQPHLDFNTIPWVIYTNPEVAWVGKTEQQLKDANIEYKKGQASFMANGRALGLGQTVGFVKILACAQTDRILGVHMIGPFVSELISEAVVAMEFKASSEDLARIIHAHPSLSEVVHEAALACDNRQLHG